MLKQSGSIDKSILTVVLLLMAFGVIFVYSSSFPVAELRFSGATFFVKRQAQRAIMAVGALFFFSQLNYKMLSKISPFAYGIAVLLLVLVLVNGESINGAKRWISLLGMRVQVSEIARIALIITVSSQLDKIGEEGMKDWRNLRRVGALIAVVIVLIIKEPDFSTSMLITAVMATMLFVGGMPKRFFVPFLGAGFAGALAYGLSAEYRMKRVLGFLNPAENSSGSSYQSDQALMGIGHGGIFGTGLGAGEQKHFFLPEAHTDFVFSILGEEIGFVGMTVLTAAYLFLIYRGFKVAKEAPDRFGTLLAFGLTMVIAFYFLMHSFVNLRMFPTTGVPLPFVSYGGMSLIFTATSIGILLNISKHSTVTEKEKK